MKTLNICIIITCLLGVLSCKKTSNQTKAFLKDTFYQKIPVVPPIAESLDDFIPTYTNSVKGHIEENMIVGSFTGKGNDTLRVYQANHSYELGDENYDEEEKEHHSYVYSSNSNIPQLNLYYNLFPSLVNEGDLDGNGTTEVGILDTWMTSSCRKFRIYTLKDGRWVYLIEPIETAENLRASGLELVEPTGIKGKVKIRYSDFNAPLSCCANAPIKDTIITVKNIPID